MLTQWLKKPNKKFITFLLSTIAYSKKRRIFAPQLRKQITGVVVQLVRIPACHAGGRGFESRPYRQKKIQ